MLRVLVRLLILIGLGSAAMSLSAPAVAWKLHDLSHLETPVALDEDHHHDANGAVVTHASHGAPAEPDEQKPGGHDHVLSLSIAVGALPAVLAVTGMPGPTVVPATASISTLPYSTADPPPQRPPSFA
jgi:hypothetical protein